MHRAKLEKIRMKIQEADCLDQEDRVQLTTYLQKIQVQLDDLKKTDPDQVERIVNFMCTTAQEAIRPDTDKNRLRRALEGLYQSIRGFEASHPRLTSLVGRISQMLADVGI